MAIDEQYFDNEIQDFRGAFCPFGFLDIKRAVSQALEVGKSADWAFKQIEQFAEDCCMKITDLDPCYVVMDAILQMARNEIIDVAGFDIQNDASFYTAGNFCATSYDWPSDDIENLRDALVGNPDGLENLSDATRYWLIQVEIDVDSLTGGK